MSETNRNQSEARQLAAHELSLDYVMKILMDLQEKYTQALVRNDFPEALAAGLRFLHQAEAVPEVCDLYGRFLDSAKLSNRRLKMARAVISEVSTTVAQTALMVKSQIHAIQARIENQAPASADCLATRLH